MSEEARKPAFHRDGAAGMRAVILAGGKGTRLRPFTVNFPKPLVPLGDRPVVEVLIRRLIAHGVTDITLTLGHLSELVKAYFGHRQLLSEAIELHYVEEDEPTGTAGSLALVPDLNDTFLVLNGDVVTDLNFHDLVNFHRQAGGVLTVATHTRHVRIDFGVLEYDQQHRIRSYSEKPETNYHVSMGVYVYEPTVMNYIEPGHYLDFPSLVLRLLANNERVCAYPSDCMWLDIGRPDDYGRAQQLFADQPEDTQHCLS